MAARERVSGQRIGMMLTAFLMVALIGVFATYAAPIPGVRGVIVEAAIAQAAASGDAGAMRAALVATKPLLGVSGQRVLAGLAPDRAGMARAAGLLRVDAQAASVLVSYRLRLMVIVIGILAALFGIAFLGIRDSQPTATIMQVNKS
ncbi:MULTISPECIES: hypothetical protein [Acidiphilium]|jgi:hypothetical protein|uniref:Uncharacterized protein n=1 Tax=Acidiphilium rubrum TaxID=526 RepID=A0A8G2CP36_ACIRU|nr:MULTISPECIES: hypothetical protein [Acidiphilium]MBW4036155.1 hypothetical protein [Pseudomonadota bacterium]SIR54816.1 hypothetical protein SAMN05421828_15111 [Acidiphilium rubrum]